MMGRKEYFKEYWKKNRVRISAKRLGMSEEEYVEWSSARRERGRKRNEAHLKAQEYKKWKLEHHEEIKEKDRKYIREYMRAWRQNMSEEQKAKVREYNRDFQRKYRNK